MFRNTYCEMQQVPIANDLELNADKSQPHGHIHPLQYSWALPYERSLRPTEGMHHHIRGDSIFGADLRCLKIGTG